MDPRGGVEKSSLDEANCGGFTNENTSGIAQSGASTRRAGEVII